MYSISSVNYFSKTGKISGLFKDLAYFKKWFNLRNSNLSTLEYQIPWMVFGCIDFLKVWLKPEMKIFEYGSGGSTLFFANKVNNVYSVEHNQDWYNVLSEVILQKKINNVAYKLIEPTIDRDFKNKNYLNPDHFISAGEEFNGKTFYSYVTAIDEFKDSYFDLVVIDGRARQSCISRAKSKIKKGGILLLDNADREYYLTLNPELKDTEKWQRKDYVGHFPFCSASILEITSIFTKLY